MRVLHLSDLHLPRAAGPDTHGLDAREELTRLLHDCRRIGGIDVVVVSGDVADDGSVEGYADALALVGAFAEQRSAAQVWCTGNHDAHAAFTGVLGSGHLNGSGRDTGQLLPGCHDERAAVSEVAGMRLISLDSLVPGQVTGRLSAAQVDGLRDVLRAPAPQGTLIALHHPPIGWSPWAAASLQDPHVLAGLLRDSDVRAVLCGHAHAQVAGALGGVPVWVGPGVVTRIDLTSAPTVVRAVRGSAATVIDLHEGQGPVFHVIHARDPRAGEQVYLADPLTWQYLDDDAEAGL